ncbi:MAG TPA: hypothetical protein VLK55_11140 [Kocuria rosea]|nr:hypothetical protein [Kocuria rosea]
MTQNPDGAPDPGFQGPGFQGPGAPRPPGGGQPPLHPGGPPPQHPGGQRPYHPGGGRPPQWSGPGGPTVPPRPPMTGPLRLLLKLTLVSFAVGVLNSVVETLAGPTLPGTEGMGPAVGTPGGGLVAIALVMGLVLTAGLYALVYFPLRDQRQWGWILGLVFCSLAVLGDAFSLVLQLVGGHLLPGLTTLVLVGVNVAWLAVASRPGVRAALR